MSVIRTEGVMAVAAIVAIGAVVTGHLYSCSRSEPISEANVVGTYQAEIKGEYVHAVMITARDGTSEYRELDKQQPDRLRAILVVKPDGTWEYIQEVPGQARQAGSWSFGWLFGTLTFDRFPSRLPIEDGPPHPPKQWWWPKTARLHSGQVVSLCGVPGAPCFKRIE
jgi:hypothetical protein